MKPCADLDYRIVIPSRKRSKNVRRARAILPTATWYVNEEELDDYAPLVPPDLLVSHTAPAGYAHAMNAMNKDFAEDTLAIVDDDIIGVEIMADGERMVAISPLEVLNYIENMARTLQALDLWWGNCGYLPTKFILGQDDNVTRPFQSVGIMAGGLRMARAGARQIPYYPDGGREDVDYFLEVLRQGRAMLYDNRVLIKYEVVSGGEGGVTGTVSGDDVAEGERRLAEKWGQAIYFERSGIGKAIGSSGRSCRINVRRRNGRMRA